MKTYLVTVDESTTSVYRIEAESEDEARDIWGSDDGCLVAETEDLVDIHVRHIEEVKW